jgi:hypothetical protein
MKELILSNESHILSAINESLAKSDQGNMYVVDGIFTVAHGKGVRKNLLQFSVVHKGNSTVMLNFDVNTLKPVNGKPLGKYSKEESNDMINIAYWVYYRFILPVMEQITIVTEETTEVIEVEKVATVNENKQTTDNKESYIVGNRNFSDYSTALQYCLESDFDPELMIIKEAANKEPLETPITVKTTQEPEIFNVYKNTFTTYSDAYSYCLKYITPVTMIISNKHEAMTNERLQELEKEYTFSKGNMSITDMKEYFQYISSLPVSLDQDERYYKIKGYIQRYEYKQQQREEKERKQKELFIHAGELLEHMKNNGLEVIEKYEHGTSLVKYIYNNEIVHTTITSGGIEIEKYHDMIENIYNSHFKQPITA